LSSDRDRWKLPRRDHLEDHCGLMRGPVEGCGSEERDPVVEPEVSHERIDPAGGIGSAERSILGPENQVEAAAGRCETALLRQAGDR